MTFTLWLPAAAGLGILARVEELLEGATTDEINHAFWHACAGGQRRAAELLFTRGADVNWISEYTKGTPQDQASGSDTGRAAPIAWLREHGAATADYK
jgi:uncharacterized protein